MIKTRETWVDDVKVFACILVALGHFFQSMINAAILPETMLYSWFNRTIYYFHVPLFFLCSGYLYQKKSGRGNTYSLQENVIRKGVSLGIPYFVFSLVTWLLKEVFSGSVNSQNEGLLHTLLLEPASPYWYLYTLFFLFLITPRFSGSRMAATGAVCAVILKLLRVFCPQTGIYAVDSVMDNALWFILGMLIPFAGSGKENDCTKKLRAGIVLSLVFLAVSILISRKGISFKLLPVFMGIWGCGSVLLVLSSWSAGSGLRRTLDFLAKYTMPVFLMHTIFAAGLRAVLIKLSISDPVIHVTAGIFISFAGPILATIVMERTRLDILLYPGKYFFKGKKQGA